MIKNKIRHWTKRNFLLGVSVLIVLLILSIVIAVAIGSTYIAPREVYKAIIYKLTNGLMYKYKVVIEI